MYKHYPDGVPETINPDAYHSLIDLFSQQVARHQKKIAFSNFDVDLSYADLDRLSGYFAAYLQNTLQIQPGDRIAIMMPNLLQYPVVMFGILRIGAIVVNVNPLYTAIEVQHQMTDAGAKAIIVVENFASTVIEALPNTPLKHVIVTKMGDLLGFIKGSCINFAVKYLTKGMKPYQYPQKICFKQALKLGKKQTLTPVKIDAQDIAFLQYTGGTTGVAKGAMLTHRNLLANIMQCVAWVRSAFKTGDNIVVCALPLYHIFSMTVCCMCFMEMGAQSLLITNPRDTNRFVRFLIRHKFTLFIGINTLFNSLLNHPNIDQVNFSELKLTIAGGMAMQKAVADRWQAVTGCVVDQGYGLTEASPVLTINPIDEAHFKGSVGMAIPSTEISIRDEEGREVLPGKPGEILARGPQVMKGYWQHAEETALVLDQEGWLSTGDIGYFDSNGYLYLIDRKKDMILVSGFNVYPNEIEEVISQLPGVREVAVIGVPSEKTGEEIKAFIVKNDSKLTQAEVIAHCKKSLTHYKIPKQIEFKEELPKSNVGKILRRELR